MDETGPRRHHLYDGSLGPAVFLAAAAVVSGEDRWRRCARDFASGASAAVARGDRSTTTPSAIGSGAASVVYGLTTIGALLGDATSIDLARVAARRIAPAPHRPRSGPRRHQRRRRRRARPARLLQGDARPRHPRSGHGLRRPAAADRDRDRRRAVVAARRTGRVYTGFAHGVAGIAYALGRLFDVTGERRFGRASSDGYRYVASRYVDSAQNWPVLGEPVEGVAGLGPSMTAWCHGAPGVTLAISLGSADTVLRQAARSARAVAQDHRRRLAAHGRSRLLRQHGALRVAVHDRPAPDAARGGRRLAPAGAGRHRPGPQGRPLLPGRQRVRVPYLRPGLLPGRLGDRLYAARGWRRRRAFRRSPPSRRRPPACGPRDPLWCKESTFMRRSAVLSLALVVALPAWAAAQVITLPAEPGFGFRDTPPTVPASRLIPQAMADAARDERLPGDVRPSRRAFVVGTDLSGVPALLNVGIAPAAHGLPAVDVVGRPPRRHQGRHRPDRPLVVRRARRDARQGRLLVRLRPAVAALRSHRRHRPRERRPDLRLRAQQLLRPEREPRPAHRSRPGLRARPARAEGRHRHRSQRVRHGARIRRRPIASTSASSCPS